MKRVRIHAFLVIGLLCLPDAAFARLFGRRCGGGGGGGCQSSCINQGFNQNDFNRIQNNQNNNQLNDQIFDDVLSAVDSSNLFIDQSGRVISLSNLNGSNIDPSLSQAELRRQFILGDNFSQAGDPNLVSSVQFVNNQFIVNRNQRVVVSREGRLLCERVLSNGARVFGICPAGVEQEAFRQLQAMSSQNPNVFGGNSLFRNVLAFYPTAFPNRPEFSATGGQSAGGSSAGGTFDPSLGGGLSQSRTPVSSPIQNRAQPPQQPQPATPRVVDNGTQRTSAGIADVGNSSPADPSDPSSPPSSPSPGSHSSSTPVANPGLRDSAPSTPSRTVNPDPIPEVTSPFSRWANEFSDDAKTFRPLDEDIAKVTKDNKLEDWTYKILTQDCVSKDSPNTKERATVYLFTDKDGKSRITILKGDWKDNAEKLADAKKRAGKLRFEASDEKAAYHTFELGGFAEFPESQLQLKKLNGEEDFVLRYVHKSKVNLSDDKRYGKPQPEDVPLQCKTVKEQEPTPPTNPTAAEPKSKPAKVDNSAAPSEAPPAKQNSEVASEIEAKVKKVEDRLSLRLRLYTGEEKNPKLVPLLDKLAQLPENKNQDFRGRALFLGAISTRPYVVAGFAELPMDATDQQIQEIVSTIPTSAESKRRFDEIKEKQQKVDRIFSKGNEEIYWPNTDLTYAELNPALDKVLALVAAGKKPLPEITGIDFTRAHDSKKAGVKLDPGVRSTVENGNRVEKPITTLRLAAPFNIDDLNKFFK